MSALCLWRNRRMLRLGLSLAFGLALLLGLLLEMDAAYSPVALAQSSAIRYVDGSSGNDGSNDCIASTAPCATIQHAVDEADSGDEIRVATGIYTGVQVRAGITQVVYVSQTVTIRGGFTTTNWTMPYPITQPTLLDARGQGRVIYVTGDISFTIEGLRITGGNAAGLGGGPLGDSGGGVYVITATATISNNQVLSSAARCGGGLFFYYSPNATLSNNTISDNSTDHQAGGLYFRNSSGATLTGNTISNNFAGSDKGMQHYGGARFENSHNVTLVGNTISGNHADNRCGGISFTSDNVTLINNNIVGNSAGMPGSGYVNSAGGGLSFVSSTNANLIGNAISDNNSTTFGGGLYLEGSDITMINNVIVENQIMTITTLTGSGSALYSVGSSPYLLHTTIARNSGGDGSGIYITGTASAAALTNTILVSHTVAITVAADSVATLNGVLWYSNTINYGGMGTITVTNEYTGNSAFAADGYHLTLSSEAIDKGISAGVTADIDGEPRPAGTGYDIGADEYYDPVPDVGCFIYLPVILRHSG
jgi:parallel beta-helix repeat protein